jgi:hypothetical protein
MTDLSDWVLVKEREVSIPYNKWGFTEMADASLWKEMQEQGLKSGLHRTGWVALRIQGLHHDLAKELKRVKLSIDRVGSTNLYRFSYLEMPECKHDILSHEMMKHRFGA